MALGQRAEAVTPSDTTDLAMAASQWIYVGAQGDLTVVMEHGETITFSNVPAGTLFNPLRVTRVMATGTSASAIVALTG